MADSFAAVKKKGAPRRSFTQSEDLMLCRLVLVHGCDKWDLVAKSMPGRNARQCRERWKTVLSPCVTNGPWSHEEDALLVKLYREYGPKWCFIARYFKGRSDSNVKNRWSRHLGLMNLDHIEKAIKREPVEVIGRREAFDIEDFDEPEMMAFGNEVDDSFSPW